MRGATHPLPQHAFMAWFSVKKNSTGTTLPFPYLHSSATVHKNSPRSFRILSTSFVMMREYNSESQFPSLEIQDTHLLSVRSYKISVMFRGTNMHYKFQLKIMLAFKWGVNPWSVAVSHTRACASRGIKCRLSEADWWLCKTSSWLQQQQDWP